MTHTGIPWLTILIAGPTLGALLLAVLPKEQKDLQRNVALAVSLVLFVLSLPLLFAFEPGYGGFQLTHYKIENLRYRAGHLSLRTIHKPCEWRAKKQEHHAKQGGGDACGERSRAVAASDKPSDARP